MQTIPGEFPHLTIVELRSPAEVRQLGPGAVGIETPGWGQDRCTDDDEGGPMQQSLWLDTHPLHRTSGSAESSGLQSSAELPDGAAFDAVIAGAGLTGLTAAVLLLSLIHI